MIPALQKIWYDLSKYASDTVQKNYLFRTVQALITDYQDQIAVALATAENYTDANISAVIPRTDIYPNTMSAGWGTLTINKTTGVCVVSAHTYLSGSLQVEKNGQRLVLGKDYNETNATTGIFTFLLIPLFSSDQILVNYFYLQTPITPIVPLIPP